MSKKKASPEERDMYDFLKTPDHYFEIFHLYLDSGKEIKVKRVDNKYVRYVEAVGTGWDGELQRIHFSPDRIVARYWEKGGQRLPIQLGKIASKLLKMGYSMAPEYEERAARYNQFVRDGISNLGQNDHREALIEKERRKTVRDEILLSEYGNHQNYGT